MTTTITPSDSVISILRRGLSQRGRSMSGRVSMSAILAFLLELLPVTTGDMHYRYLPEGGAA